MPGKVTKMEVEDLLVRLSFAEPDVRIEGLKGLIDCVATEEPEAGQVDDEHPLLDNLQFLVNDQDPDIRCVPLVISL